MAHDFALEEVAPPGLVAGSEHQVACDRLLQSLVQHGFAVISNCEVPSLSALDEFWIDRLDKAALQPVLPTDFCGGYRLLSGDRELLEHRVGPWMRDDAPLPALHQASQALDAVCRAVVAAALRSALVRLPGTSLAHALDDLPLPPHAWASSTLQCYSYGPDSGGCEPHVDKGLLTAIHGCGQGLQVQGAGGGWTDVDASRPDQLVVLAGYTLEHATCGLIKAACHRTFLPPGYTKQYAVYKLAASPAAVINLLPALQAAGHSLRGAAERYPQPASVHQIIARFDATHRPMNPPRVRFSLPAAHGGGGGGGATPTAAAADALQENRAANAAGGPGSEACGPKQQAKVAGQEQEGEGRRGGRHAAKPTLLSIAVRGHDGEVRAFSLPPATQASQLAAAYSQQAGVEAERVRLMVEGEVMWRGDTLGYHYLRDGDTVDAMLVPAEG